ncbi:hypothetical protein EJV46_00320 [Roseococcus sp. SYP-B2431]|uniref:hypothetical protein n=1 Tax=Roseococcus sp. SYP-B2431 TaxID=2496640 RepID=UPI00103E1678|nr:hypothetical protein [Roseococcus sp. SYP-B2431]TCI00937.1 hypothetical protein EJV46_00320 [Roseococcus sp. SYP-B2431]
MLGRRAEDRATAELRELVAQLERSGLAERRVDVRQLLESSRSLLHAHRPALAAGPPLRAAPSARKLAGKLRFLLRLALDALVLAAFLWGCWSAVTHRGPMLDLVLRPGGTLVLAGPAWLLLRLPLARDTLHEVGCRLLYHLAWGWDWFAEAFSRRAMRRLSARLAAREVMWAWRRQRRSLLHRPGPRDVEAFLELAYGPGAAEAFRGAAGRFGAGGWSLRGGSAPGVARHRAAARLEALRWSVLIRLFEGLAASGSLWPAPEPPACAMPGPPPPSPATGPPLPAASEPEPSAPPEVARRRVDLAELIRKKRQDITNAYGWKLKTEAEIAQRDAYLRQTRKEIGELERELAALGG